MPIPIRPASPRARVRAVTHDASVSDAGRAIAIALLVITLVALLAMPAHAQAAARPAGTAPANSAAATTAAAPAEEAPHFRRSWTSDRREYEVGDIITVLVDENTLASATKGQSGSDVQSRDLGINAPSVLSSDLKLGSSKSSASRQTGEATRDLRFRGEMTVRVLKVSPSGVLEVKGERTVDVDKNKQTFALTGFVRPQDVSSTNVVLSARIADAQVTYTLTGELGATKGGIIGRLISVFWP